MRKVMLLLREKLLEGFSVLSRKKARHAAARTKAQIAAATYSGRLTLD
jgi:hypothetical protein